MNYLIGGIIGQGIIFLIWIFLTISGFHPDLEMMMLGGVAGTLLVVSAAER